MGGYDTEQELWFSVLYGGGVYRKTGETGECLAPAPPAGQENGQGSGNAKSGNAKVGNAKTEKNAKAGRDAGKERKNWKAGRGVWNRFGKRTSADSGGRDAGGVSRGTAAGISLLPPSGVSPVLTNLVTGEKTYLRLLPDGTDRADFIRRVLSPPSPDLALWPVDLLALSAEHRKGCTLLADHAYLPEGGEAPPDDAPDAGSSHTKEAGRVSREGNRASGGDDSPASIPDSRGETLAAVFFLSEYEGLRGGQTVLDSLGALSWKNPAARSLAVRLTEALDRLNRDGWLYHDLHPSRLFFQPDGQVFFDYSNLSAPVGEAASYCRRENYPMEFGDPAVVRGIIPRPDGRSQNYSLCALLFYVLFGRFPCDGALLAGYPDDDPHNHYVKFRDYHRMPLFLFDPEDDQNAPGTFAEDEALWTLWRSCPEELRRLFTAALCRESAERRGGRVPEPAELLDCFRRLGWDRRKKKR